MALTLRDSFIDVHLAEDELKQHVLDVIKARPTGPSAGPPFQIGRAHV